MGRTEQGKNSVSEVERGKSFQRDMKSGSPAKSIESAY